MATVIELTLNGRKRVDAVPGNRLLLDYLRETAGLTGTKTGCDGGECGACTVLVDDRPTLSCLTLAARADGRAVTTVEGLARGGTISALQKAFADGFATQCGFCTAGMLVAAQALLDKNPDPDRAEVVDAISGNICRCTGYEPIVNAILAAAADRRGAKSA